MYYRVTLKSGPQVAKWEQGGQELPLGVNKPPFTGELLHLIASGRDGWNPQITPETITVESANNEDVDNDQ